ncbi:MAG: protein-L-isoaspartate(D-aspartate) O-methyltransferase [Nitrospirae bacterium]|nr:protein-L-isoaspartate(D-aspartate) O-methyltransferase [Nitrospirota bacterium]
MDYAGLRELMVRTQLISRGIRDERLLSAMRKVPRHLFVEEELGYRAYDDMALSIGQGQTISQPYMVAIMTELIELKGDERVLEVGTGSGYQAGVLAELSKEVYTIERVKDLSLKAERILTEIGYRNIHFRVGDGTLGLPDEAPFNRIIITAGTPSIPPPLLKQLANGGIIVAPVGDLFSQRLLKVIKHNHKLIEEYHTPCVFVPLLGEFGWKDDSL